MNYKKIENMKNDKFYLRLGKKTNPVHYDSENYIQIYTKGTEEFAGTITKKIPACTLNQILKALNFKVKGPFAIKDKKKYNTILSYYNFSIIDEKNSIIVSLSRRFFTGETVKELIKVFNKDNLI